jgi:hypothetical protein
MMSYAFMLVRLSRLRKLRRSENFMIFEELSL